MVLILPLWLLNKNIINFNNKKLLFKIFIKDCYVVGSLNLIIQIPLNFLFNSLFYAFYNTIVCLISMIVILYFYCYKRFKIKTFITCIVILFIYYISLIILISNSSVYLEYISTVNNLWSEFVINIWSRLIQFLLITFIFGGKTMFKKILKKIAKENLTNTIASTAFGVGEPKLSDRLRAEIKKSK